MKPLLMVVMFFCSSILCSSARAISTADVAGYVRASQTEILIAVPVLRVSEIANELHLFLRKSRVKVRIITGLDSVVDSASYFWTLQRDGAIVRTVPSVSGFEMILDGQVRITGDFIGKILAPDEINLARVERGAAVAAYVKHFEQFWATAILFPTPLEGK